MGCVSSSEERREQEITDVADAALYDKLVIDAGLPAIWKIFRDKHYDAARRLGYTQEQVEKLRRAKARQTGRIRGTKAAEAANKASMKFAEDAAALTIDACRTFGRIVTAPVRGSGVQHGSVVYDDRMYQDNLAKNLSR